ncbi:MAG: hypothetical protein AUG49_17205 [Catenulispora sp. 13_1_20CM_3_70_7]|nr:MAG: hypothetical protein AUG49_17205 [Catenulispora sp. 13_1_20CM_3_70_7]
MLTGVDGSLPPVDIALAADGRIDIVFVIETGQAASSPDLLAVTTAIGTAIVADFDDVEALARTLAAQGVARVITFTDRWCRLAAQVEHRLWPHRFGEPTWGRKDVQRSVLRDHGSSRVAASRVDEPGDLRRFASEHGFPVVLKPADGVGSRDLWLLRDQEAVETAIAELAYGSGGTAGPMFVEEYIAGDAPAAPHLGDYVSAEVFRRRDPAASTGFVTDRLAPIDPCRETGMVLPTTLSAAAAEQVLRVADHALDALGAPDGTFHVEVKPRPAGSEVIEVNGRLGGYIARLAGIAAGADLAAAALSTALGRLPELNLVWRRCALVLLFQAPPAARRIVRAPERAAITRLPGVVAVDVLSVPGGPVDWRDGSSGAVARVWIAADDPSALRDRLIGTTAFLTEEFGFTDADGAAVTDRSWLERIAAPMKGSP